VLLIISQRCTKTDGTYISLVKALSSVNYHLISTIVSRAEKLTMKNFTKRKLLVYMKGSLKYEDPNDSGFRIN
jgi:hypothetical protein